MAESRDAELSAKPLGSRQCGILVESGVLVRDGFDEINGVFGRRFSFAAANYGSVPTGS